MNVIRSSIGAVVAGIIIAACGSGNGVAWTYAPLGPTPDASAAPTAAPSAAPSAATSPGASPGLAIEVATNQESPLTFMPNVLSAPPATAATVTYNNNSNLPHNIRFFDGPDSTAPSLGATETVTGPNAPRSVTFNTPDEPGDYYFWCDVHGAAMAGTLQVAQ